MNSQRLKTASPAQLWLGSQSVLEKEIESYLKGKFCSKKCNMCFSCQQIEKKQHHSILWLRPEKKYTRETIVPLFKTISFELESTEQFYFILDKSDTLSTSCANSLLKTIEEPPPGYHFILLAQRKEYILPTIQSRCKIVNFDQKYEVNTRYKTLVDIFTNKSKSSCADFLYLLQSIKIQEHETVECIDILLSYWIQRYKKYQKQNNIDKSIVVEQIITILKCMVSKLPMPGSSTIFWKNLYLQLYNLMQKL